MWWFVPNTSGTTNPSEPLQKSLAANGINIIILNYNSESDNSLYSSAYGSLANSPCSSALNTINSAQNSITAEGAVITADNATQAGIQAAGEADLEALPYLVDF